MGGNLHKVPSACERCRKQKLKCDIERPCTLCVRASIECITPQAERWRFHHPPRKDASMGRGGQATKRRRLHRARDRARDESTVTVSCPEGKVHTSPEIICPRPAGDVDDSAGDTPWNASSTITLVEQAFHQHEAPSPEEIETSAFAASAWVHTRPRSSSQRQLEGAPRPLQRILSRHLQNAQNHQASRTPGSLIAEKELLLLLPELEAATILLENYFDRIHWFTLLFYQRDFRNKFRNLYDPDSRSSSQPAQIDGRVGYIAVLLAVFATSLHYTNAQQRRLLLSHGIEAEWLKDKILTGLKLRFLDIISLGSLEVVQMCILLGSYYLYHGEPQMAWSLCGSGLRTAQALNLHRKVPNGESVDESYRYTTDDRKRAWWAIYEIETFCSMLYGFPLSISDSDCDVAPLNPYDEYSCSISEEQYATKPNLLFFKCAMSKLSAIIKSALVNLYGTRCSGDQQGGDQTSRLKSLVNKVASLSSRLLRWYESLTPKLKFTTAAIKSISGDQFESSSDTPEAKFEEHLFRLQALSLKLAYENATILIHRPLLSFRMRRSSATSQEDATGRPDPFQMAMHTCRDAAMQISQVGSTTYLREASETYAITFVSLHLLTAGVTLCISISLDPLSWKAYESRMGIRRLMQIQNLLKDKSIVAAQGLDITTRLMSLVMAKEVDAMFEVGPPTESLEQAATNKPALVHPSNSVDTNSTKRAPEQTSMLSESQASLVTDAAPHPLESPGVATDLVSAAFDGQYYDFCENTLVTEAVLEYEQAWAALTNPLNANTGNEPVLFDNQEGIVLCNTSLGQDQGWIWGWNFLG